MKTEIEIPVGLCQCGCGRPTRLMPCNHKTKGLIKGKPYLFLKGHTIKHGHARTARKTSEYQIWKSMIARCSPSSRRDFKRYAGRGITVCDRWLEFQNFYADMGNRPSGKHSIDRIDNNGNYEPSNCRWATDGEQCRNRRSNILVTIDGRTLCLLDWSREIGIHYYCALDRIRRGWDPKTALLTPPLAPSWASRHSRKSEVSDE
jgi:hypothetical protein